MVRVLSPLVVLVSADVAAGCGSAKGASSEAKAVNPAAVLVSVATAAEQPITRFARVTGTLAAE